MCEGLVVVAIDSFSGPYAFLSNFSPSSISVDGIEYPTVEHAYQAAKTLDENERRRIAKLPNAAAAKKAGRQVVLRREWEQVKVAVMRDLLQRKFADPHLQAKLRATADEKLVEGNWWGDRFWGVCNGRGENWLGKLLMEIRAQL